MAAPAGPMASRAASPARIGVADPVTHLRRTLESRAVAVHVDVEPGYEPGMLEQGQHWRDWTTTT